VDCAFLRGAISAHADSELGGGRISGEDRWCFGENWIKLSRVDGKSDIPLRVPAFQCSEHRAWPRGSFPAICMCRGKGPTPGSAGVCLSMRAKRSAATGPSCHCQARSEARCLITPGSDARKSAFACLGRVSPVERLGASQLQAQLLSYRNPTPSSIRRTTHPLTYHRKETSVPRRGDHHTHTMALLQMKAPVDYDVQLSEYRNTAFECFKLSC
jgi:hypothetical protein